VSDPFQYAARPCSLHLAFQAASLGFDHARSELRKPVEPPRFLISSDGGFDSFEQTLCCKTVDQPVERAGIRTQHSASPLLDGGHDLVTVELALGYRQHDFEGQRGQGKKFIDVRFAHSAPRISYL